MKVPSSPPRFDDLWRVVQDRLPTILSNLYLASVQADRYLHWDELRFRQPPPGINIQEWWFLTKLQRRAAFKQLPLRDVRGVPFNYFLSDDIAAGLHQIDTGMGGIIQIPEQVTSRETRDRYVVRSLMEEAITSSQLEGAATTRDIAKDMIRTGRAPRDRSEQMILNNYRTMQRIVDYRDERLTPELVLEIHRVITAETLEDPSAEGRLRRSEEKIQVVDMYETVLHDPPQAEQLPRRVQDMCEFANEETPHTFVHPVLRSIILHFWLAYDHPFVDGNGRAARALFYWSMLRQQYWLCEFISISQFLRKAPAKYGRAFLYTETDDNDLTYFIIHQLRVMRRAIQELHNFIQGESDRLRQLRARLRGLDVLNHRQRALVDHALRHSDAVYSIESHQVSHNIVYETARTDLLNLEKRGLLVSWKTGRAYRFRTAPDFEDRLAKLR